MPEVRDRNILLEEWNEAARKKSEPKAAWV
jgi:hypothetical protein